MRFQRCLLAIALLPAVAAGQSPPAMPISATAYQDTVYPVLMDFCGDCHHPDDSENVVGFLRDLEPADLQTHRGLWASVAEQLSNRTMPPADATQPDELQRLQVAGWINDYLRETACEGTPTIGAPAPRRLNRDQYAHAIADLFGQTLEFGTLFPSDGSGGEGFTNHADSLFVSPILLEKYLEAVDRILEAFLIDPPVAETFTVDGDEAGGVEFWLGGTQSLVLIVQPHGETSSDRAAVVVDGIVTPLLRGDSGRWTAELLLSDGPHRIDWNQRGSALPPGRGVLVQTTPRQIADEQDQEKRQVQSTRRTIDSAVAWLEAQPADKPLDNSTLRDAVLELWRRHGGEPLQQRQATTARLVGRDRWDTLWRDPISAPQANEIVLRLARRAWRRPLTPDESQSLTRLLDRGIDRGQPVLTAMRLPITAVLISPKFLFVTERSLPGAGSHPVSDLELASRLSLMLWNSIPDDELLDLAGKDQLSKPAILDEQIARMVGDPKVKRMGDAFAAQWLGTDAVGRTKIPDTAFFKPAYSSELVEALTDQVGETFVYHVQHDRPLTDWFGADYVIVNGRLAKHYGLPLPQKFKGETFGLIPAGDDPAILRRSGVLGLGAVHVLTSYGRRTSPVLRGGWVLETCFGVHLPAPPDDVPELPGGEKENGKQTVRERLAEHRDNPTCAACHNLIDPIGFALENFDVLGRWREYETGKPVKGQKTETPWDKVKTKDLGPKIDPSGQMPTGETFADILELRQILLDRRDEFTRHYVRKMLGYSLGRSLDDGDACTIEQITARVAEHDYSTMELIRGIVQSDPFRRRDGI